MMMMMIIIPNFLWVWAAGWMGIIIKDKEKICTVLSTLWLALQLQRHTSIELRLWPIRSATQHRTHLDGIHLPTHLQNETYKSSNNFVLHNITFWWLWESTNFFSYTVVNLMDFNPLCLIIIHRDTNLII
jgi:hypothetical protein